MAYNKIKWVLGVLLVFFLILATNFIDRNNFNRIKDSMVNIYEDRLLTKGFLFDMSLLVNEKTLANQLEDTSFYASENSKVNSKLDNLITQFKATTLTAKEESILNELSTNINDLKEIEGNTKVQKKEVTQKITQIKTNLVQLSNIQLEEGKRQMFIGKKAIDSVELLTQIEIYCLVFLAIVVQIIILSGFKKKKKKA